MNFTDFKENKGSEDALQAFKEISKSNWSMLLVYGSYGNGKSMLCEILADEMCVPLLTFPRIIRALKHSEDCDRRRSNEGRPWIPFDELMRSYCHMDVLIIDDVGMGISNTGWEADKAWAMLEEIVYSRYDQNIHGERKVTVLTTNRDLKELPKGIVDRFRDKQVSRLVFNSAESYRAKKEVNNGQAL